MEKKTFEECKHAIAEKYSQKDWVRLTWGSDRGGYEEDELYLEVCELYADQEKKAYAMEAVKADRDQILEKQQQLIRDCFSRRGGQWAELIEDNVRNLPIELP